MEIDIRLTIEDGKVVGIKTLPPRESSDATDVGSQYSRFFDESCRGWRPSPRENLEFLRLQEEYANMLLRSRGHLFLNEVYDMLGMPRTRIGAKVGWLISGDGDKRVDFGLSKDYAKDFISGKANIVLLDFNVDGVVIYKI